MNFLIIFILKKNYENFEHYSINRTLKNSTKISIVKNGISFSSFEYQNLYFVEITNVNRRFKHLCKIRSSENVIFNKVLTACLILGGETAFSANEGLKESFVKAAFLSSFFIVTNRQKKHLKQILGERFIEIPKVEIQL